MKRRIRAALLAAAITFATAACISAPASSPAGASSSYTVTGADLHDGTITRSGGTYYMYGTRYGCGFTWSTANTPWCGFGVATSASISGPWKYQKLLFSPDALDNWGPDAGRTWNWVCGSTGAGCFNPRMQQRRDGVWVLWFNAPRDYFAYRANAYYVMGCNGPAGPCGYQAGAPHGSTHKPSLRICAADGDFSILTSGPAAAILCSMGGIGEETLTGWWADGTGAGTRTISGMPRSLAASPAAIIPVGEGEGGYQRSDGTWVMTYSLPGCGFCSGPPSLKTAGGAAEVKTGYATAPAMTGPWTVQGVLSPDYCEGQPRTVFSAGGQAYEWLDRWTGSRNETAAAVKLEPMTASPWSCS